MLNHVELARFGPLKNIAWKNLGRINLIIGGNGSGKTFLLKALYSAVRTLEEYRRGDDKRLAEEILAEKLYWTFQPEKIGDLVMKGGDGALSCAVRFGDQMFRYQFGKDTARQIQSLENTVPPRLSDSVFLPAKEVLSLFPIIFKSREQDKMFGFDDTYLDLARALRLPKKRGRNYDEFVKAREILADISGGCVEYDEGANRWYFKKGNQRFAIGVTAEGIKKISILDTLLGNRYLDNGSLVFIDEPESALHPTAITQLLDIVTALAECGVQVFLASHSYFVVKKLFLIAQQKNMSIPVLSAHDDGDWRAENLQEGMPDNSIVNESIRLYKEEVELVFQ